MLVKFTFKTQTPFTTSLVKGYSQGFSGFKDERAKAFPNSLN